jgi:hypothetical protein
MVDDRTSHATIIEDFSPTNVWAYFAKLELNVFSLAGMQQVGK